MNSPGNLVLLRELRFKCFAFTDGTAEACGLIKLALQGAAMLGKLRERVPERCTGACGTDNGRVGYWCCRTLRAEELIPCARFVRLAAEGVERVILRECVGDICAHTGETACRNEREQRGGGRIVGTVDAETEVRYFLTDHLGSVRVVATDQNNVLERNDYYPFGKRWDSASLPISDNRDRFNGKEDQVFIGDCLADYGARMYDRERGRWLSQDPLQQYHSPYVFCGNNPIRLIDLDGMEARDSTSVMIPPVIVYPSEDGEGGGHSNSFWRSPIPGYSLDEIYEAFKSSFK